MAAVSQDYSSDLFAAEVEQTNKQAKKTNKKTLKYFTRKTNTLKKKLVQIVALSQFLERDSI